MMSMSSKHLLRICILIGDTGFPLTGELQLVLLDDKYESNITQLK